MTEEEKKAIEDLHDLCIEVLKHDDLYEYHNYSPHEKMTMVDIVLNLIEKQQNRIDELEKALVDEDLKHRDKINKVIDKLKLFKNDLKEYDKKYESKKDVPVGAIVIRINELLKILEE